MTSINQNYTFNYSQPDDYRFSHDSVFLAQLVFEYIKNNPKLNVTTIADLCAGCGIIGMDLLFHLDKNLIAKQILQADFIEVQKIYELYFKQNKSKLDEILTHKIEQNFVNKNYADICNDERFNKKYDIIVCNPPYFKVEQGKLSPSDFKNRCRFFIDSDFFNLIQFVKHSLKHNGSAFVLVKDLKDHKLDFDLTGICAQQELNFEKICDVRGTPVYRFFNS